MEFSNVMYSRRAVRNYKPDPIPEDMLQKLYRALRAAPTANNMQPFQFIFVKDEEKRRQIASQACHQAFLLEPPVLMVACCKKGSAFDVAIAVDHMTLAAVNEGLATCWIGWFEGGVVRRLLDIPEDMDIPILMPIGFPGETPPVKDRKRLEEIIKIV